MLQEDNIMLKVVQVPRNEGGGLNQASHACIRHVYTPLTGVIQGSGNNRRIVYLSSLQLICVNLALEVKQDSAKPHGPKCPKQGPCRQPLALSHAGLPTQWPHDHAAMPGHDSPRDQPTGLS